MSDEQDTPSIVPALDPSGSDSTAPDEPHSLQAADPAGSDDTSETGDTGEKGTPSRAWWLSTRRRRPEWHSLTAAGTATFTGRPRAHYEAVRQGDPVLFYLARPDHGIRAVGVVVEAPQALGKPDAAPDDTELRIEVQLAFEVTNTLGWRSIQADPRLADAEPVRQRSSGTLFALTTTEYRALESLIAER